MNKYVGIVLAIIFLMAVGIGYRTFMQPAAAKPVTGGAIKNITVTAVKNQWRFTPNDATVVAGDTVNLTVINEDDYDHGLAIDAYGVSQRMPAKSTINISFTATKPGDFPMYCSVPCGEGVVDGKKRTHFDMISTLHVVQAKMEKP